MGKRSFIEVWQSAFQSFSHYFKEYGEVRFGIITDTWFEDEQGNAITITPKSIAPSMIIVLITATKKLLGLLVLKISAASDC